MKQHRWNCSAKTVTLLLLTLILTACVVPYTDAKSGETVSATNGEPAAMSPASTTGGSYLLDVESQGDASSVNIQQVDYVEGDEAEQTDVYGDTPEDGSSETGVLALWINGERVVQTPQQVAAWEKGLYACQTEEEYNAYLENVAYYNKGVDMSRFEWTWDELRTIYTEEQIALLKKNDKSRKKMLNAVGLTPQQAYRMFTDAGFIVRISYQYSDTTDIPAGYCYAQEAPAGQLWMKCASFFIYIQVDRSTVKLTVPYVVGQSEAQARQCLTYWKFANVDYQYEYSDCWRAGLCMAQSIAKGTIVGMDDYLKITISLGMPPEEPTPEPPVAPTPEPSATPTPSLSEEPSGGGESTAPAGPTATP